MKWMFTIPHRCWNAMGVLIFETVFGLGTHTNDEIKQKIGVDTKVDELFQIRHGAAHFQASPFTTSRNGSCSVKKGPGVWIPSMSYEIKHSRCVCPCTILASKYELWNGTEVDGQSDPTAYHTDCHLQWKGHHYFHSLFKTSVHSNSPVHYSSGGFHEGGGRVQGHYQNLSSRGLRGGGFREKNRQLWSLRFRFWQRLKHKMDLFF